MRRALFSAGAGRLSPWLLLLAIWLQVSYARAEAHGGTPPPQPLDALSQPSREPSEASQDSTPQAVCPAHCQPRDEDVEREDERSPRVIDLNTANERTLLDLPGIGPARARAILDYRVSHGGFRSISQLLHIKGIGRALLKQLRPLITLSNLPEH